MSNFSYIIPFRSDTEGVRTANLRAVLRWLSRIPSIEVLVVEQDRNPSLFLEAGPSDNCGYVFTRNDGPFNKSRAFNAGFLHSEGRVIAFGDADLLVNPQALLHCFEACHSQFHAVKPYDRLVDLTPEESQSLLAGNDDFTVTRSSQQLNREGIGEHLCFCGGLFVMRRGIYEELGGFDERFLGWGGEDDAMSVKLSRLVPNIRTLPNQPAFHLWHERTQTSRYGHPHYQQNVALLQQYAACSLAELRDLCANHREILKERAKSMERPGY